MFGIIDISVPLVSVIKSNKQRAFPLPKFSMSVKKKSESSETVLYSFRERVIKVYI